MAWKVRLDHCKCNTRWVSNTEGPVTQLSQKRYVRVRQLLNFEGEYILINNRIHTTKLLINLNLNYNKYYWKINVSCYIKIISIYSTSLPPAVLPTTTHYLPTCLLLPPTTTHYPAHCLPTTPPPHLLPTCHPIYCPPTVLPVHTVLHTTLHTFLPMLPTTHFPATCCPTTPLLHHLAAHCHMPLLLPAMSPLHCYVWVHVPIVVPCTAIHHITTWAEVGRNTDSCHSAFTLCVVLWGLVHRTGNRPRTRPDWDWSYISKVSCLLKNSWKFLNFKRWFLRHLEFI